MEADCVALNRCEARRVDRGMGVPRNRVKGGSVVVLGAALRLIGLGAAEAGDLQGAVRLAGEVPPAPLLPLTRSRHRDG